MAIFARPSASAPSPLSSSSLSPGELGTRRGLPRARCRNKVSDEAIRYKGRQVTRQGRAMATSHGEGQSAFERVARSGSVWVEIREPRMQADVPVLLGSPAPTGSGPM